MLDTLEYGCDNAKAGTVASLILVFSYTPYSCSLLVTSPLGLHHASETVPFSSVLLIIRKVQPNNSFLFSIISRLNAPDFSAKCIEKKVDNA